MDGFKQGVCQFLHNGRRLRTDALLPLIEKLQELKAVLSTLDTFRFYTSSLLLAYEGLDPEYSGDDEPSMITDDDSSNDSTTMHSTTAGGIRIIHGFKEINSPSSILGMMSSAKSADSIITRGQSLDESTLPSSSSSSSSSSSASSPPASSQQSSTCHPPHQDDDDCAMDTTDVNAASTTTAGVTTMTASTSGNDVTVAAPLPTSSSSTAATSSSTSSTGAGCRMVGSISSDAVSKMTAASITGTPLIQQQSSSSSSSTLRSGGSTGTSSSTSAASLNSEAVDVRMIDFAHSCHAGMGYYSKEHTGPDTGYIFGLQNLIKVLQEICDEHCGGYDMDENSGDGAL